MLARVLLATLIFLSVFGGSATAGKNSGGALVVHTDDDVLWSNGACDWFDDVVPQECDLLNTRTEQDENIPAFIWMIAAFADPSRPCVTSIDFGVTHNLPPYYHNRWGWCGPSGTVAHEDPGWPDDPDNGGNRVEFSVPIEGDRFFPFYYVSAWGFAGAYYGTAIHPNLGYAAFEDDSFPPVADAIWRFGEVRWYEEGYNVCPTDSPEEPAACCTEEGDCWHVPEDYCLNLGGDPYGPGTDCDPNPCPISGQGVCCFEEGQCSIETPLDCEVLGGTYYGDEEPMCDPNPCPQPPLGACCLQTGICITQSVFDCEDAEGIYLGEGTVCSPNPCFGACCYSTNDCHMLPLFHCDLTGGDFQGAGSVCDPNPCTQYEVGVCCRETGTCTIWTEAYCLEMDGVFRSGISSCDPNPCYGACCFYSGDCQMLPFYWCMPMGGSFMGAGSDCDPNPCVNSGIPDRLLHESTWGAIKARYR